MVLQTGLRIPLSARPWRSAAYIAACMPLPGVAALGVIATTRNPAVGVAMLAGCVVAAVATSAVRRKLVVLLGRPPVADPHPPGGRFGERLRERPTWLEVAHLLAGTVLLPLDAVVLGGWLVSVVLVCAPLLIGTEPAVVGPVTITTMPEAWLATLAGLVLLVIGCYAAVLLAELHALVDRLLLGPHGNALRSQVTDLARSRLRLVNAFDVERRRIERDLHDGAQQQLVTLAMTLDMARIELEDTPHRGAAELVDQAHTLATRTITELHGLINAIHPPALADGGLPAAVGLIAERCALPLTTAVDLPERLSAEIESAAYFVINEAVVNAVKHSGAASVDIHAAVEGGTLVVTVRDAGTGGASPDHGTGLTGLGDRVAALGGRLTLSSPPGGPTVVRAELPVR
ncbi:sensor histidine kinase [Pseudonocardia sp. TRM90224]|uniref:sensor histidine kinase n=1 Tax=Pseudonocardia sp. TRM90224 TaxID=2812678 RepID=UPI001E5B5710|nr:sensor histidine kinase [Pseudonocardia sp. TRM90224]